MGKSCGNIPQKLGNGIFSYRLSFQVYWNEMMTNGIKKKKATASIFCLQLPYLLYMENLISPKMKNIAIKRNSSCWLLHQALLRLQSPLL